MGRVVTTVLIVLLAVGCFGWWRKFHAQTVFDGTVHRESASDPGSSSAPGDPGAGADVHPAPSRSDVPGTLNGEPSRSAVPVQAAEARNANDPKPEETQVAPSGPDVGRADASHEYPRPDHDTLHSSGSRSYVQAAGDSQSAQSPDGERVGGAGVYQWYRQGDLTYRINTRTGESCIIYATMDEWRKPSVYRHGCKSY